MKTQIGTKHTMIGAMWSLREQWETEKRGSDSFEVFSKIWQVEK